MSENNANEFDKKSVREGIIVKHGATLVTRKWVARAAAGITFILLSAGINVFITKQYQQQAVVFDMKGTIDLFMQQSAKQQLDENTAKAMTTRFNNALKDSLNEWQQSHNALVLVPPAVVMPQRDITREIQADIAQRMQGTP